MTNETLLGAFVEKVSKAETEKSHSGLKLNKEDIVFRMKRLSLKLVKAFIAVFVR